MYEVTDLTAGITYMAKSDESLFNAMMHTGGKASIKYGCAGGGCGICKVKIEKGEYETFKNMSRRHVSEAEEAEGIVLACCVKPKSDISLSKYEK